MSENQNHKEQHANGDIAMTIAPQFGLIIPILKVIKTRSGWTDYAHIVGGHFGRNIGFALVSYLEHAST